MPQARLSTSAALGLAISAVVFLGAWFAPLPGLAPAGQQTLALTLFAAVWWLFGVIPAAYTTLILILGYLLVVGAEPEIVFRLWTLPLMWLVVSAFLLAAAVTKTGLARRLAYIFMLRYARSYTSIVVLAYVLGFVLSLLIPQSFPRTLLIMAVVKAMISRAGANPRDATTLGFAVFVSGTVTSTILLTGDAILNVATVTFADVAVGWLDWVKYMGVPGVIASLLMMGLHFLVFKPVAPLHIDHAALVTDYQALGPMRRDEKVALGWLLVALALWSTDKLHGIDPAWVGLAVVAGLALPVVGAILTAEDINTGVNWPVLLFVTGAFAIGAVGQATGMAAWMASVLLPATPPANPFMFALMASGAAMVVHMFLGSVLATMSIVSPPLIQWAVAAGWNPLFPALLVYTAGSLHYLFPFQQVLILLGVGELGGYSTRETLRYGIPLTLVVLIVIVLVEVPWWMLMGLI